ncbi:hypothetical protein Tco_0228047 [Tanacetum coccineum]
MISSRSWSWSWSKRQGMASINEKAWYKTKLYKCGYLLKRRKVLVVPGVPKRNLSRNNSKESPRQGFAAVLAVLKPERLKVDKARNE